MNEIDILIREFERAYLKASASSWGNVAYYAQDAVAGLENISLYMRFRAGPQAIWGRPCLVLASIDVHNSGKGTFSELLRRTKDLCRERGWILQVENVLNPRFRKFLQRGGFQAYGADREIPCGSLFWLYDATIPEQCSMYPTRTRV